MQRGSSWSAVVIVVSAAVVLAPLAHAEPVSNPVGDKDASRLYQEATSAFGLGHYAEAAEKYEGAFSLRPDPALLYNAAQSYRLAGIKTRAIELYRNYLRLYPLAPNASDARAHVASLQKAIDWDLAHPELVRPPKPAPPPAIKTPAAPVTPLPAAQPSGAPQPTQTRAMPPPQETGTPAKPPTAPAAPQPGNEASASLVAEPGAEGDQKPMTKESWFWVSCGAGAVLLGAMVFLFVNRSDTYPDATFGTARGN